LGFSWLIQAFCPASAFVLAEMNEARNPQRFIHAIVRGNSNTETTMKRFIHTLIIICLHIQGCDFKTKQLNHFSSSADTLIIKTETQKDRGPFVSSHVPISFDIIPTDSIEKYIVPAGFILLKSLHLPTDYTKENPDYVDIITGLFDNKEVFIVDENNNNSFQDDSVRQFLKLKWDSPEGLIKCMFQRIEGQNSVEDSTWIQLRLDQNDVLWLGRKEHLTASISIDDKQYLLGAIDLFIFDFTYSPSTWISVLSENGIPKDTLLERDILTIGEYLKIGQYHYRFDNITSSGEYLTLVKEKDFHNKVGIQIGMIAPEFECVTVSGDTINSSTLHDKLLVVANSCGCGGDIESTEAYYQILEEYGDKMHVLRLDSKIDRSLKGFHIDMQDGFNKDLYQKYRNEYCSRTCFIIDKENRIIDRFPSQDWKIYLPNLYKEHGAIPSL
jgi:hypothetical protein